MKPGELASGTREGVQVVVFCVGDGLYLYFWQKDPLHDRPAGYSTANRLDLVSDLRPLYIFEAAEVFVRGLAKQLEMGEAAAQSVAQQLFDQLPKGPEEPQNPGAVVALVPRGIAVRTAEGTWFHNGQEKSWDQLNVAMIASPGWVGDGDPR